jgi:4-amino-4-deoxy-L-arabinose transferase-like glycosyltransferase
LQPETAVIRHHRPLILLILLTGFALRIIGIVGESPPGVAHDEVAHWLIARSILDEGNHTVYFTQAYGHEAGYHYLEAIFLSLLGDNLLALRLPAVFSGLLGIAVTYALAKRLFGVRVALLAAGLLAVLFWPVFYGRLALRAISLPVVAGLSAVFWWKRWGVASGKWQVAGGKWQVASGKWQVASGKSPHHLITSSPPHPLTSPSPHLLILLSGFFAGLSLYTYLAARAVPIFYTLFVGYLALVHREGLKQRWRGVVGFTAVFLLTAFPLFYYLQTHPNAEIRVAEVSKPLADLLNGNPILVLENGLKLAGMFSVVGDPLWREGVPDVPIFEPVLAILFYGGVLLSMWRWRDGRYAFILLWLLISLVPSLVTINAPSHIRSINALVVMSIFPAIFIHKLCELSTDFPQLSPKTAKLALTIFAFTFFLLYAARTVHLLFNVWPAGGDVPFVWQAAFAEAAGWLDGERRSGGAEGQPKVGQRGVALAGWSPETMDSPTMMLLRQDDERPISHFNPQEGTLIIPNGRHLIRPTELPLDPFWEEQLLQWGAIVTPSNDITHYALRTTPPISPQFSTHTSFGNELHLLGYDITLTPDHLITSSPHHLITYWQVTAVPSQARRLFIHFLDENGNQIGEAYAFDTADPQSLWFPHWQPGDLLLQRHELPDGVAQIRLGWYDPYSCNPGPCQNLPTDEGESLLLIEVNSEQ